MATVRPQACAIFHSFRDLFRYLTAFNPGLPGGGNRPRHGCDFATPERSVQAMYTGAYARLDFGAPLITFGVTVVMSRPSCAWQARKHPAPRPGSMEFHDANGTVR
jgi:hypothetical protein